jgi:2-polyprenyl-3-methyl-5-hydroxy-6-metoxy-1,4-benzoquinol methylase
MPVNFLHGLLHRVEDGWDPISPECAAEYADHNSNGALRREAIELVKRLEMISGGLKDKSVLDLGGGPGQFSVLFALRGAKVVWHDVSREYQRIAQNQAAASGVSITFSLGYLEAAKNFGPDSFDAVFCRVCWYYCRGDRGFADLIYSLIKPGGIGYIECNTPAFSRPHASRRLQYWLNAYFWLKIGHPMPPHGRIAELIQKYPVTYVELDYSSELADVVLFVKRKSSAKCPTLGTL